MLIKEDEIAFKETKCTKGYSTKENLNLNSPTEFPLTQNFTVHR
jgi:hypothetical protein